VVCGCAVRYCRVVGWWPADSSLCEVAGLLLVGVATC
jgi:hypothetical protein